MFPLEIFLTFHFDKCLPYTEVDRTVPWAPGSHNPVQVSNLNLLPKWLNPQCHLLLPHSSSTARTDVKLFHQQMFQIAHP